MDLNEKIKLSVVPHPFKTERIDSEVDRKTYKELFEEHVDTFLPIEHALIFDKDRKIALEDFGNLPESNNVIIKMLPAGDDSASPTGANDFGALGPSSTGSGEGLGTLQKTGGFLLTVLGAILLFTPLSPLGGMILGAGLSLFYTGTQTYKTETPDLSGTEREAVVTTPSIRGAKNKTKIGGNVPILLGTHLLVPDTIAIPYSSVSGNEQRLHQLFCFGYNDITIDESTLKIGDNPISNYNSFLYNIQKNTSPPTHYPKRIIQNSIGLELVGPEIQGTTPTFPLYQITSTNTRQIDVEIVWPNGVVFYTNEGEPSYHAVWFSIFLSNYDGTNRHRVYNTFMSGSEAVTKRGTYPIVLDNDTSGGSDYYDEKRQYKIEVYRVTPDYSNSQWVDSTYLDSIKSHTASYDSNVYSNNRPVDPTTQGQLAIISVDVLAENQLKGVIDQLNAIGQLHTLKYDGVGSGPTAWSVAGTNNPASMFRYILQDSKVNPHPTTDAQIDWASLEEWYTFCVTKEFECNAVLNGNITVADALNNIASTGRAGWVTIDGKYSIIIDDVKPVIIQMFTPRNSTNFVGRKTFPDNATMLKIQFIDSTTGYTSAERDVYVNDAVPDDSVTQSVSLFGAISSDQAWKIGKYMLATSLLRPEAYSFTVDIENLVCTKGDRISIAHDSALIGISQGRVKLIFESGGDTDGFTSDELLNYEAGKDYAVKIRLQDGTIIEEPIVNQESYTDFVDFVTPIIGTGILLSTELFSFGELGEEVLDLIVAGISPAEGLSASLTCVEYSPEVFDADSGVIPEYNPVISNPGDGTVGLNFSTLYDPEKSAQYLASQDAINAGNIARAGQSLIASRPDAFSVVDQAFEVCIADSGEIIFVDRTTSILYKTRKTDSFTGTPIGDVVASNPANAGVNGFGNSRILYVNKEDNDRIYLKNITDLLDGTPVTTSGAERPQFIGNDELLYIGFDGFLYRGVITDALDGVQVTTFSIGHYVPISSLEIIYSNWNDDSKLYRKASTDDLEGTILTNVSAGRLAYANEGSIYYINYDDGLLIYKINIDDTITDGIPAYLASLGVTADSEGNVVFISLFDNSTIYSGLLDLAITDGFLEASPNEFTLLGDLLIGSTRISNITSEALDEIAVKDSFYHEYLSLETVVLFKGNDYVVVNISAGGTSVQATIEVAGTRIILDANRVIIDGTVTANLLEASAINSKAKTDGGFYKSEYDLDSGAQLLRRDDDTIMLDFDADRTGSELLLGGTLVGVDGEFTGTLTAVDGSFSGTLDAVSGVFEGLSGLRMEAVAYSGTETAFYYDTGKSSSTTVVAGTFFLATRDIFLIAGGFDTPNALFGVQYLYNTYNATNRVNTMDLTGFGDTISGSVVVRSGTLQIQFIKNTAGAGTSASMTAMVIRQPDPASP
jgi:hypothetical protein